jgi:hypothetical protein
VFNAMEVSLQNFTQGDLPALRDIDQLTESIDK